MTTHYLHISDPATTYNWVHTYHKLKATYVEILSLLSFLYDTIDKQRQREVVALKS